MPIRGASILPGERQLRLLNILARQATDYLERKQSEQPNQTIVRELQHRSNNLLAVIQSLAHRSLDAGRPKEAFEARLQALARANRALFRSNWSGAYIDQIVLAELEAFAKRVADSFLFQIDWTTVAIVIGLVASLVAGLVYGRRDRN